MPKYYGPNHTYRYEVRGVGPTFYTDNRAEAIRVAIERAKATKRITYVYDVDENIVGVYDFGVRYDYLRQK